MRKKLRVGELRYGNIEVIEPDSDKPVDKYTLKKVNERVFKAILESMAKDGKN